MGIIEVWTLVALVLHFCEVGAFKDWAVFGSPLHWSCLCIEMWAVIFYAVVLLICLFVAFLTFLSNK